MDLLSTSGLYRLNESVFRAGHPGWRRCSSLEYSRYARSSRLAIRAPRSEIHYRFSRYRPLHRQLGARVDQTQELITRNHAADLSFLHDRELIHILLDDCVKAFATGSLASIRWSRSTGFMASPGSHRSGRAGPPGALEVSVRTTIRLCSQPCGSSMHQCNRDSCATRALVLALEELHRPLVLLGCGSARKSAEVSPATRSWIDLSRGTGGNVQTSASESCELLTP